MKKMIMLVVTIMVMAVALTGCNNPFRKGISVKKMQSQF